GQDMCGKAPAFRADLRNAPAAGQLFDEVLARSAHPAVPQELGWECRGSAPPGDDVSGQTYGVAHAGRGPAPHTDPKGRRDAVQPTDFRVRLVRVNRACSDHQQQSGVERVACVGPRRTDLEFMLRATGVRWSSKSRRRLRQRDGLACAFTFNTAPRSRLDRTKLNWQKASQASKFRARSS